MAATLDRRRNAFRDDLADQSLEGSVKAARFVAGRPFHVSAALAPVHVAPGHDCDRDTEALGGEALRVYDISEGWAWCQLDGDGYVGYVPVDLLSEGDPPSPTHRVSSREAFAYAGPNAGSRPLRSWLLGSPIRVVAEHDDFFELAGGGFIGCRHVEAIDATAPDYAATAIGFLGVPYLWGGKSVRGIDCSGLVQLVLQRAGIPCPRDTDMQERELPGNLAEPDIRLDALQRGDLVYWPGHVGIMIDAAQIVHANGTRMSTTIEPVTEVAERSRKGGPIATTIKRIVSA